MNLLPHNVRSRLTAWYVGVLGLALVGYAVVALTFLFLNMREQLDHDLVEDVETVEGLLANEPGGFVSLRSLHPEEGEPRFQRFIEVWSPDGSILYRSAELGGQTLGSPPGPEEGAGEIQPLSERLRNGLRVRVASSVYHIEDHRVVVRIAHNEESLWHELGEFAEVLGFGLPLAILFAAVGGYALAWKALAPIDAMAHEAQRISAERLSDRLSIRDPKDELGKLAGVFNAMLERLQGAFDQLRRFTADASHELRTPLTAIRSVGEVALQDGKKPEEYRDVIGSMLEEVDRLTRLVESLLALSRADAGHIHLHRANISLLDVAREAIAMVEVLAEEKKQRLEIEGDGDVLVSADRVILGHAIVNLLDNAIKYSPENTRILVRVGRGAAGHAWLDVSDEGPGIPSEHQPYVFDRFYRVDKARSREWGGAGLGLAITQWAVGAHSGEISLDTKDGKGSTFHISLPLAPDPTTTTAGSR
jgi:heavy metal sensor kinase